MNPIQAVRAFALIEKIKALTREKGTTMQKIPQYIHLAITLIGVLGVPTLAQQWLAQPTHSVIFMVLVAASVVLHSISPSIFGAPSDDAQKKAGINTVGVVLFALAVMPALALSGCTNWERATFQTLSASQATINQAQADYEAGTAIPHNKTAYTAITAAKLAHDTAVNHMVVYEQLKATGASASALAEAENQTTAAVAELPELITQIKALYGAK